MITIDNINALSAKERELWAICQQTKKADQAALNQWAAAREAMDKAIREREIEQEVQRRMSECSGQLAQAALDARQIGMALATGATTLDECLGHGKDRP